MDFTLSSEQIELQDSVRKFAKNELTTVAAQIELTGKPPNKKIIQKFSDMGFLGVNLPQKYGGLGMSNFEAVLVLEEVAKISIALAFPVFESCFGPALAISYFASEKLKEKTNKDIGESSHFSSCHV